MQNPEPNQPESDPDLGIRLAFLQVILITCLFFFNFGSRLIPGPFLVHIEQEFSVSHAQAGGLFFILSLGISLALLLSGFVASRLQHKKTILVSALGSGFFMILASWSPSLTLLKLCLFLQGLSLGLYLPSAISTITSLLPPNLWGRGLATHELAPNSSFIFIPALAAAVENLLSWREVFALFGLSTLAMALFFAWKIQGGRFPGQSPNLGVVKELVSKAQFWALIGIFCLAVGTIFGTYSMLPLYLVEEHQFSTKWANQLLSLSRVPCLGMALAAGLIIERIGAARTILWGLACTGTATLLLGLLSGKPLQAAVLIQPMFAVCLFPANFTAISSVFRSKIRNVAISFIIPVATVLGTGMMPAIMGWFGDQGHFPLGFTLLGLLAFPAMALVRFINFAKPAPPP
ncbi:MAG: MFS transporter [Desulfohalobiaceae bacterium]